jgi:hypothetical protein
MNKNQRPSFKFMVHFLNRKKDPMLPFGMPLVNAIAFVVVKETNFLTQMTTPISQAKPTGTAID